MHRGGSGQSLDEHIIAEICEEQFGSRVIRWHPSIVAMTMVLHVQHKLSMYVLCTNAL